MIFRNVPVYCPVHSTSLAELHFLHTEQKCCLAGFYVHRFKNDLIAMDELHFTHFISLWPVFGSADATQPPSNTNLQADDRGNDRSLKASKHSGQTQSYCFQIIILYITQLVSKGACGMQIQYRHLSQSNEQRSTGTIVFEQRLPSAGTHG